jgi:hypothetical protein
MYHTGKIIFFSCRIDGATIYPNKKTGRFFAKATWSMLLEMDCSSIKK